MPCRFLAAAALGEQLLPEARLLGRADPIAADAVAGAVSGVFDRGTALVGTETTVSPPRPLSNSAMTLRITSCRQLPSVR